MYAILTLSGINITMLVKYFFCHRYHCLVALQVFGKVAQNWGVWGRSPQTPTGFYGFHIESTHLDTLFIVKGRTVPAVTAIS